MGKGPKKSIPFENSNLNPRDLLREIVLLVGTNVSLVFLWTIFPGFHKWDAFLRERNQNNCHLAGWWRQAGRALLIDLWKQSSTVVRVVNQC